MKIVKRLLRVLFWGMLALLVLTPAVPAADTLDTWTLTGSLDIGRNYHTATLLPNGKVLVAGGQDGVGPFLASCELYDPALGTWTATGFLNMARAVHTATLLANGKVLVAGGVDNNNQQLTSAELYDAATGTWTFTGSLNTARNSHTATTLDNGKVMVVGGYHASAVATNSAEIYDQTMGTWTPTGSLHTARNQHTATLLGNGKVLVAGGWSNYNSQASAELYDPACGTWTTTGNLVTGRYIHTATLLTNGQVLVSGGSNLSSGILNSAELYDPATGAWTATGPLADDRGLHTATLLANGQVLVAGGADHTGHYVASAEFYNPATGVWTDTGSLHTARMLHTATLLSNGQVLVAGGTNGYTFLASAELYHSNAPPVANAGLDQTVHMGAAVNLNGSGSSDPDGNLPLTYKWRFVSKPPGSAATLSNDTAVSPSFVADVLSIEPWILELVVTDSLGLPSAPATVRISTANSAPVADAGPDQAVTLVGTTVYLGTDPNRQSYDPDGDPLTYSWSLISAPSESTAALANPTSTTPSFVPDKHGDYEVQLVVSDPWTAGAPDTMKVSFANIAPVANAGPGQAVVIGAVVNLNGSGSSDANGDPLTYQWDLTTKPTDSILSFSATTVTPSFTPDVPGDYVVQLIVNDGLLNSQASTVQIQVSVSASWISEQIRGVIRTIGDFPPVAFKNKNLRNTLINKLQVFIKQIDEGKYAEALAKVQEDVIAKTNGCAIGGKPDGNDWIIVCLYQEMIYPDLLDIARHLAELAGQ
jgi:N-acetylneuraminic acid mutarotase